MHNLLKSFHLAQFSQVKSLAKGPMKNVILEFPIWKCLLHQIYSKFDEHNSFFKVKFKF